MRSRQGDIFWTRSSILFAGVMVVWAGCADGSAAWECSVPGSDDVVSSDTLTCQQYREAGDQLLEQARNTCASDQGVEACTCSFVELNCGNGSVND